MFLLDKNSFIVIRRNTQLFLKFGFTRMILRSFSRTFIKTLNWPLGHCCFFKPLRGWNLSLHVLTLLGLRVVQKHPKLATNNDTFQIFCNWFQKVKAPFPPIVLLVLRRFFSCPICCWKTGGAVKFNTTTIILTVNQPSEALFLTSIE